MSENETTLTANLNQRPEDELLLTAHFNSKVSLIFVCFLVTLDGFPFHLHRYEQTSASQRFVLHTQHNRKTSASCFFFVCRAPHSQLPPMLPSLADQNICCLRRHPSFCSSSELSFNLFSCFGKDVKVERRRARRGRLWIKTSPHSVTRIHPPTQKLSSRRNWCLRDWPKKKGYTFKYQKLSVTAREDASAAA